MVFDELAVLSGESFVLCETLAALNGADEIVFSVELEMFLPSTGAGEFLLHPLSNAIAETKAKIFFIQCQLPKIINYLFYIVNCLCLVAFKRSDTRPHHFDDTERFEQINKAVYLGRLSGKLEHNGICRHVYGFCAVEVRYLDYLVTILCGVARADKYVFARYGVGEYLDLVNVIKLHKLVLYLFEYAQIGRHDDSQPRDITLLGLGGVKRLNVVPASCEQPAHARQNAGTV